jgi:hypothetical protein
MTPLHADALATSALLSLRSGDLHAARRRARLAATIDPNSAPWIARVLSDIADGEERRGDRELARAIRSIAADAEHAAAWARAALARRAE